MNYSDIKKLDEKTIKKLTEGFGPSDECLCSILAPPEGGGGFGASLKKVFAWPGKKKAGTAGRGQTEVDIPLTFSKRGKGVYTTKEVVKRASSCGKCGCDNENVVLKHSYANIRITSPDVSSICPCPTDCLPDREKLMNNIKVTIEHLRIDPNTQRTSSLPDHSQIVSLLPANVSLLPENGSQQPEDVRELPEDTCQKLHGMSLVASETEDKMAK